MSRRFTHQQRAALLLEANATCHSCHTPLQPGWHADHITPWSRGGPTDTTNGQALCPTCNLSKGPTMTSTPTLRRWQTDALHAYEQTTEPDFLLVACPGAGKTRWSLTVARRELDRHTIDQVVVVVPSETLKYQWADNAAAPDVGIDLKPDWRNSDGAIPHDFHGVAVTYQQLASLPDLMRMHVGRARTLVILDEIHHCATTASWGDAIRTAFEPAVRRIASSGTPFRTDGQPIPFITYDPDGTCIADHTYGYAQAITDQVCRPLYFPQYGGTLEWHDGRQAITATFDDDLDRQGQSHRLRTALAPNTDYMHTLLTDAHHKLTQLRTGDPAADRTADPTAAGLVLAMDQQHATQLARMLTDITGTQPVIATSDEPDARQRIAQFDGARTPWLVAVRMVSEGTDLPCLRVMVYATNYVAPLFFRQAAGRVVRVNADSPVTAVDQDAYLYLPDDPRLRGLARDITREVIPALRREPDDTTPTEMIGEQASLLFTPVRADGQLASVTHGGQPITAAELAHATQLGGQVGFHDMRDLTRVAQVLRLVGARPAPAATTVAPSPPPRPKHERVKTLRALNNQAARQLAFQTLREFADINRTLNDHINVTGIAEATEEQLQRRLDHATNWLRQLPSTTVSETA